MHLSQSNSNTAALTFADARNCTNQHCHCDNLEDIQAHLAGIKLGHTTRSDWAERNLSQFKELENWNMMSRKPGYYMRS